ncbi:hypothetical protein [Peribacillus simplex]|uniref:hypothetical protein n=1 Tax=Peribacillus simplex TaxID=1478 RepID=UPI003D2AF4A0
MITGNLRGNQANSLIDVPLTLFRNDQRFFLFALSMGFILSHEDIDPDEMKIERAIYMFPFVNKPQ